MWLPWWLACATGEAPPQLGVAATCDRAGHVCTWLGTPGVAGQSDDGQDRLDTLLYLPADLAFDGAEAWYADARGGRIRRVGPDGVVTTVSGADFVAPPPADCWGGCDAASYPWRSPRTVARDPADPDSLWALDATEHLARIDLAAGRVYWEAAGLTRPSHLVVHRGKVYVADPDDHVIQRLDPATGTSEVLAGTPGRPGFDPHHLHGVDGGLPLALLGDQLLVGDTGNGVVRAVDLAACAAGPCPLLPFAGRYTSAGASTALDPITGQPFEADLGSVPGYAGDGGDADEAVFDGIQGLAVGRAGEVYVADTNNHCVRVVTPDHTITTFAGRCTTSGFGGDGRPAAAALLHSPVGVALDGAGAVYVADSMNQVVRRVSP